VAAIKLYIFMCQPPDFTYLHVSVFRLYIYICARLQTLQFSDLEIFFIKE